MKGRIFNTKFSVVRWVSVNVHKTSCMQYFLKEHLHIDT